MKFFGDDTNIHRVWDSDLIDRQQLSYSEWTKRLKRQIEPKQAEAWMETDPKVWIAESVKIRAGLYPDSPVLSWDYQYAHVPTVKQRLQMGGVRIAAYLNQLFSS